MVSISHEDDEESERRLRDVIRAAEILHLPGAWSFCRVSGSAPSDALATVRDRDGWCALAPATEGAAEIYAVTSTTFSSSIDNSGFVGWLATTIKRRLGSGVFVVCGDNPARGGIFDYLGYPIQVADAVRDLIDELRRSERADALGLDLRLFRVTETSSSSAISSDTVFQFREVGGVVEASFSGGDVVKGWLVGRRRHDRVETAYAQLIIDGELRTGTATMRISPMLAGGLQLTEEFTWSDSRRGRNILVSIGGKR